MGVTAIVGYAGNPSFLNLHHVSASTDTRLLKSTSERNDSPIQEHERKTRIISLCFSQNSPADFMILVHNETHQGFNLDSRAPGTVGFIFRVQYSRSDFFSNAVSVDRQAHSVLVQRHCGCLQPNLTGIATFFESGSIPWLIDVHTTEQCCSDSMLSNPGTMEPAGSPNEVSKAPRSCHP